jgi:heat shock protein HslJ
MAPTKNWLEQKSMEQLHFWESIKHSASRETLHVFRKKLLLQKPPKANSRVNSEPDESR